MEERYGRSSAGGCVLPIGVLLLGVVIGVALTLGLLGVGFGALVGRVTGQGGVVVVTATPAGPPPATLGGANPGRRLVWRVVPLDSDTSEPDLLVISRNYDRGGDSLVYLSPDAGEARWESPALGENGNSWTVAFDESVIAIADEARLIGISRADGSLLWEAPLTDRIFYNVCNRCLRVVDGRVVALSDDGTLQAFDAQGGAPLWSVRMREAPRQLLVVDGLVGVPDRLPEASVDTALYLFNLADGSPAREILPVCTDQTFGSEELPGIYAPIYQSPDGGTLYWVLGSSPCIISVDARSGRTNWVSYPEEDFYIGSLDEQQVLVTAEGLYIGSDSERLVSAGAGGTVRTLLVAEDYELRPLEANGDTLLVEALRRRGTARYELWAVDLQSGERRWERVLAAGDPLIGGFDDGTYAAKIRGDAVALVEQLQEPERYLYELIDLRNGASRVKAELAVAEPDDDIRSAAWGAGQVFLGITDLYSVSLERGAVVARWP